MAYAEKLPSGKYRGVYRVAGKRKSVGTFTRKSDAIRTAATAETAAHGLADSGASITWGNWEPLWREKRLTGQSTQRTDEYRIARHVRPKWSGVCLEDITTADVQSWVSDMARSGMAPTSVAKAYYDLSASLKAAVKAGRLLINPCKGVDLPKPGPSPERFLTDDELDAIRSGLAGNDRFIFELLLGTGMRFGEAQGLHWESVDLDGQAIRIEWSYSTDAKHLKPPKSHQARTVPIGDTLTRLLRERLENTNTQQPPAGIAYVGGSRKPHTGLVLAHVDGKPINAANFRHRFAAAVNSARVRGRGIGNVRIHDLRHTFSSRLVQANVPLLRVSRLLGHRDVSTTQRYAGFAETQDDRIRSVLG
ncbi:tyrosine-type recombinase/integrase [Rhodococcus pyridinivorans]|uniref:tyrosine-type recombinase/integrase n=1 Tax=Rhodococcus pyridinivorans TaxID=103816 RepID=UPI001585DF35|nr:site-specific integrase [Rhodococcus pyridinivorans]